MKVTMLDTAHESIENIFDYLAIFSSRNAIQTVEKIYESIDKLKNVPYIGIHILELQDKHFRELICKKNRNAYRIIYFISENIDTIHVVHVSNCKQDFNRILRLHNYFKNFLNF